jgi:hypothetical protein
MKCRHQVPFRRHLISFIYLPCCPVIRGRDAYFHLNEISNSERYFLHRQLPLPPSPHYLCSTGPSRTAISTAHLPPSPPAVALTDQTRPGPHQPAWPASLPPAHHGPHPVGAQISCGLSCCQFVKGPWSAVLSARAVLGALERGVFIH